jgi:N-acetylneuraminic acid mutarotase
MYGDLRLSDSVSTYKGYNFASSINQTDISSEFISRYGIGAYLSISQISGLNSSEQAMIAIDNNMKLRDRMTEDMFNETNYNSFKKLEKDYFLLFESDIHRTIFSNHTNYISYIKSNNAFFGDYIESVCNSDNKEFQKAEFSELSTVIQLFINSEYFRPDVINTEYIVYYINKLINFFKSYTIHINSTSFFLSFSNKYLNGLKLLDNAAVESNYTFASDLDYHDTLVTMHSEFDLYDTMKNLVKDKCVIADTVDLLPLYDYKLSTNTPSLYLSGGDIHENNLVLIGGYDDSLTGTNSVYSLNLTSMEWEVKEIRYNNLPSIHHHTVTKFNNKFFVVGGITPDGNSSKFYEYDLATNEISIFNTIGDVHSPVYGHCSELIFNKIFIYGGIRSNNSVSSMYVLSPYTRTLERINPIVQPIARNAAASCVFNNRMYVFGGLDNSNNNLNDFFYFDPITNEWVDVNPSGDVPSPRYNARLIKHDRYMYLHGGSLNNSEDYSDLYRYDVLANTWEVINLSYVDRRDRSGFILYDHEDVLHMFGGRSAGLVNNSISTIGDPSN